MKKLKEFYKNNRIFVILMGITFICLAIILVIATLYFLDQNGGNPYGNRLNGIETVKITDQKITEMQNTIKENEKVENINIRIIGKIIYINVYLSSGKGADAKNIAIKSLDLFNDDEKAFYDLSYSFDLVESEDTTVFPIMGYKKSDNTIITWTNFSE